MDDQKNDIKEDEVQRQLGDSERDEQTISYYDALLQSIRDGIEDPDLMLEEDLLVVFSEECREDELY